jgi:hypothetical protein
MNTDKFFLNGRYRLEIIPHEMRMSLWVDAPLITDTQTNTAILDLRDSIWSLRGTSATLDSITLTLARYPDGNKEYKLCVYPEIGEAKLGHITKPILQIRDLLDAIV